MAKRTNRSTEDKIPGYTGADAWHYNPRMVAAISNSGGLGSLPVGGLSPDKTVDLIHHTRGLTAFPFAVNLFAHTIPEPDMRSFEMMQDFLETFCLENNLSFERQAAGSYHFYSCQEQVRILLNENIPVVSFTFGILDDEAIKAFKDRDVILIGTATCLKEAKILDEKGIDIIAAQGIEAGGHRGTFLQDEPLPLIGSMSLIPQLVNHIQRPIVAAGGINDGRTIMAAFILGARGVQVGTAFIASPESLAISSYKNTLQHATDTDSVLTKSFSGRWARGLRNKFIEAVDGSGLDIPEYPLQNNLTASFRKEAQQKNDKEFINMWAGQSAFKTQLKPAADIFNDLIRQTEEIE